MSRFKIVIVGGGLAGMATAVALRKEDREITVLEQSALNREIGAVISLQPNASKIVEKQWGLEEALRKAGSMVDEGFRVYNLDGELQLHVPLLTTEKYGAERMLYHRVDLHEALKQRAMSPEYPGIPATLRVSSRATHCDCEAGIVHLENGEAYQADLIVGADGIKSTIRDSIIGKEAPAQRTGHSAYRMMLPVEKLLAQAADFCQIVDPRRPYTTMVVGHDRRMVMGPARNGTIYSIVAMVPDENMEEDSADSSWTTYGNRKKMLESFATFPGWARCPLTLADEAGLWQLRDLDPLPTWAKGKAIIVGDAAHAMLPTQGQGASQAVEDAEAIGAFYADFESTSRVVDDVKLVKLANEAVFDCRFHRATTIQAYSRQAARPGTDPGNVKVRMSPGEFMDYNCNYSGALEWARQQRTES